MHQAGAAALSELLQFPAPARISADPCSCGQQAHYRELRSKPVLTAVGKVEVSRPYYLCPHCHTASFPPTSNWISKTRNSLPACAACRPWWARKRPSIMDASR